MRKIFVINQTSNKLVTPLDIWLPESITGPNQHWSPYISTQTKQIYLRLPNGW